MTRSLRSQIARITVVMSAAACALFAVASPAGAHVGGPTHGLADGALHPIGGSDHLLAMVAVGIVAAVGASRARTRAGATLWWAAPLAFLAALAVGGAIGLAGGRVPAVELAIVGSVVTLGLAVTGALATRVAWALPLLALAGLVHGNAHGAEAPGAADPVLYVVGFLLATAVLHLAGVALGSVVARRPFVRVALGAAIAAAGVALVV